MKIKDKDKDARRDWLKVLAMLFAFGMGVLLVISMQIQLDTTVRDVRLENKKLRCAYQAIKASSKSLITIMEMNDLYEEGRIRCYETTIKGVMKANEELAYKALISAKALELKQAYLEKREEYHTNRYIKLKKQLDRRKKSD